MRELLPRVELGTSSLPRMRSTTELKQQHLFFASCFDGAEDGAQTRDPQLGRLVLYRLSYFRMFFEHSVLSAAPQHKQASAFGSHLIPQVRLPFPEVGGDGFEPPKSKDNRFTVCPIWPLWKPPSMFSFFLSLKSTFAVPEPLVGFEPTTPRLQITCSGQLS